MCAETNTGPNPSGLCMCGCGNRTRLAPQTRSARGWVKGQPVQFIGSHRNVDHVVLGNPSGLCMCGCGGSTRIASNTRADRGWVKGHPISYIRGHEKRGAIVSATTRAKISAFHKGRPRKKGEGATGWKGGKKMLRGRLMVYVGHEHPMARTQVYVMEHRLVLAEGLGRVLRSDEHVHHLDLDETNNAVENLVALTGGEHRKVHWLIVQGASPLDAMRWVMENSCRP